METSLSHVFLGRENWGGQCWKASSEIRNSVTVEIRSCPSTLKWLGKCVGHFDYKEKAQDKVSRLAGWGGVVRMQIAWTYGLFWPLTTILNVWFGLIHYLIPFVSFFLAIYKMRLVPVMILYVEWTWKLPAGFYKHKFAELCTPGVLGNCEHLEWEPKIASPKSSRVGLMLLVWTPIVRNMSVFNISKVIIYSSYSFPHS